MRSREEIEKEKKKWEDTDNRVQQTKTQGLCLEVLLDIRDQNAQVIDLHETLASRLGLDIDPPMLMKHLKDILDYLAEMPTAQQLQRFEDNVDARLRT